MPECELSDDQMRELAEETTYLCGAEEQVLFHSALQYPKAGFPFAACESKVVVTSRRVIVTQSEFIVLPKPLKPIILRHRQNAMNKKLIGGHETGTMMTVIPSMPAKTALAILTFPLRLSEGPCSGIGLCDQAPARASSLLSQAEDMSKKYDPEQRKLASFLRAQKASCSDFSGWSDLNSSGCDRYASPGWPLTCAGSYPAGSPGSMPPVHPDDGTALALTVQQTCCSCGGGEVGARLFGSEQLVKNVLRPLISRLAVKP